MSPESQPEYEIPQHDYQEKHERDFHQAYTNKERGKNADHDAIGQRQAPFGNTFLNKARKHGQGRKRDPQNDQITVGYELVVKSEGQKPKQWLISGGTARFTNGQLTVLAEEGVVKEELVRVEIDQALVAAKEQKALSTDPAELIQLEKRLRYETFKRKTFE